MSGLKLRHLNDYCAGKALRQSPRLSVSALLNEFVDKVGQQLAGYHTGEWRGVECPCSTG